MRQTIGVLLPVAAAMFVSSTPLSAQDTRPRTRVAATKPRPASMRVPEADSLLPWSQQIAIREQWLSKRHEMLLPMMRRHGVGMWIVVN